MKFKIKEIHNRFRELKNFEIDNTIGIEKYNDKYFIFLNDEKQPILEINNFQIIQKYLTLEKVS